MGVVSFGFLVDLGPSWQHIRCLGRFQNRRACLLSPQARLQGRVFVKLRADRVAANVPGSSPAGARSFMVLQILTTGAGR